MTCKISFIKSVKETLKHHMASIFIACVVFFTQLIVFFLNIQSYTSDNYGSLDRTYITERIFDITAPSFSYVVPVIFIAIILAFDFFRYLHSRKQIDFYESLPVTRKQWFCIRTVSSFLIFIVPYLICTILEIVLLTALGFTNIIFFTNLFWNCVCMILIFLVTWLTGVLAMIMTGHPVTAFFGFCVFSAYAPILLRYLYPAYATEYFKTFTGDTTQLYHLNYLSPIGLAYKLINANYMDWTAKSHVKDFIIILIMIVAVGILSYVLFLKRPSEAAGRAMAFEKCNSVIRIMLVIPATLYIGLYLSLVAAFGTLAWMIFGFIIGTVLLHGIVESIFQFDIRGLWAHKRQMIGCFIATILFSCLFWFDLFQYDAYLPEIDELDSISIKLSNNYYDTETKDGISGEYLDEALLLAQNIVQQNMDYDSGDVEGITFSYHLKNGSVKQRQYYMNFQMNQELFDKLYTSKDFKNDICKLYTDDWSSISYIEWDDSINRIPLYMPSAKLEQLFTTYIAEYTPLTYTKTRSEAPIGRFILRYEKNSDYSSYSCDVYSDFVQTIALLNDFILTNEDTAEYGEITESILDRYTIRQLEFYKEENPLTITGEEAILALKEHLTLGDAFYKKNPTYNWEDYYDVGISLNTDSGIEYTSAFIERKVADKILADYNF